MALLDEMDGDILVFYEVMIRNAEYDPAWQNQTAVRVGPKSRESQLESIN